MTPRRLSRFPANLLGTLRSNDADGKENVKKKNQQKGFISKTRTLHAFLYISFPVFARLRKCLILRFMEDINKQRRNLFLFLNLDMVPRSSIPGGFAYIWPGGVLDISLGGRWGSAPHTMTLFKTKIADFPTLFKTEFRFLIPSLRHS